jgi:hypothetical protein
VVGERLTAQLLSGEPARDPVSVAERLLAVQAQDPRGARLAIRARTAGLHAADVERAFDDRALVVSWVNRGTLHLVRSEDYPWLHALTTPQLLTGCARRLAQEGVLPDVAERGVEIVERSLAREGPLTRGELRERLDEKAIRTEGQALVHILMLASLRGLIVRGPMRGREQAYVLAHDWLGTSRPVDRDGALAELARRYLAGHGPASDRDLARWAGITLGDARAGLAAIARELEELPDDLVALARRPAAAPLPPPRLLGQWDPVLLGWVSREPLLSANAAAVVTVNGLFRPFALAGGRAVATWSLRRGAVEIAPFGRLARGVAAALRADADDVVRFLGV